MATSADDGSQSPSTSASEALRKHAVQREELLDEYFRATKLLVVLQAPLTDLATAFRAKRELPASPYPLVLQAVRQAEIRRALELRGILHSVPSATNAPVLLLHEQQRAALGESLPVLQLSTTQELLQFGLWSFAPVLERSDAELLARRVTAIRAAHQRAGSWFSATEEEHDGDYRVAVYGALVGSENRFALADAPVVELERHVLVAGEQLEQAMTVFARQLVKCLHEHSVSAAKDPAGDRVGDVYWSGSIRVTSCVPASEAFEHEGATSTAWTAESVNANRNAFTSAVKLALVQHASFEVTSFRQTRHADTAGVVLRLTQRLFFHFEFQRAKAAKSGAASQQQQSRSFLEGSRARESGVFLDGLGAFEIARRVQAASEPARDDKKSAKLKNDPKTAVPAPAHGRRASQPRATALVDRVLATLELHCSASPGAFRHWVTCFSHCCAFESLRLVLHIDVLITVLELRASASASGSSDSISETLVGRIHELMETLVSQARVGSESSLARSVASMLEALWKRARDNCAAVDDSELQSGDPDATECVEQLERLSALLMVVAHTAARDFVELFLSHHQSSASGNAALLDAQSAQIFLAEPTSGEQIDVLRALRSAVQEREYPPIVALEAVFAQFVVDSCVDVALESAVMNIVAFHLPPNPFVELSHNLRAFALRQLVWSCPLSGAAVNAATRPEAPDRGVEFAKQQFVSGSGLVCSSSAGDRSSRRVVYGHNSKLLEILDVSAVSSELEWLRRREVVLASCDYHPPKGSYSVRTLHSLLLFHPLAFALEQAKAAALVSKLEVVEHIVLEGREWSQALEFFADAVTGDLRRLLSATASTGAAHVEVNILDGGHGHVVSDVDYARNDDAKIRALVQDATLSACVMHAKITFFAESDHDGAHPLVRVVGKTYVFHHDPTDSADAPRDHSAGVPELLAFRLKQFGVFFSAESAAFVLKTLCDANAARPKAAVPRAIWTPAARHALENDDLLLKYELDFGAPPGASLSTPFHDVGDHKRGALLRRLVLHSSILQLHALDSACQWLLCSLEQQQSVASSTQSIACSSVRAVLRELARRSDHVLRPVVSEMTYVDGSAGVSSTLRSAVDLSPGGVHSPRSRSAADVRRRLRQMWLLVRYVRFSYERDFFGNY